MTGSKPKAVVQDGSVFRIYENEDRLGDRGYLVDEFFSPRRCKNEKEAREWFKQTLAFRALGDVVWIGGEA